MKIKIIQVEIENKGKYNQAKVAYEDLDNKKVTSKNIVDFANKEVYKILKEATPGDFFDVSLAKDDKGYWQWKELVAATEAPSAAFNSPAKSAPTSSPRSTYDTPEERAKRQVYIVRQSSVSNAIELLSTGAKSPPKVEEVLDVAKKFENYVFGIEAASFANLKADVLEEEIQVE